MKIIYLARKEYYLADELRENKPEYFEGISGSIRSIIEKKEMREGDFVYGVKKGEIWEISKRDNRRAKLLIEKDFWDIENDCNKIEELELKIKLLEIDYQTKIKNLQMKYERKLQKKDERIRILELEKQWLISDNK